MCARTYEIFVIKMHIGMIMFPSKSADDAITGANNGMLSTKFCPLTCAQLLNTFVC